MESPSEKDDSRRLEELLYQIDELIIQLTRRIFLQVARQAPNELTQGQFVLCKRKGANIITKEMKNELTQGQFVLCKLLKKHGRMSVSELAESLGVSLSAVTVTADKLCRAGIMRRERDEQDRRVVWLLLTEEGYRVVSDAIQTWNQAMKGYFARLPEGDLEKLISICEKLLVIERADRAKTALKEIVPADEERAEAADEERAEVKEEG